MIQVPTPMQHALVAQMLQGTVGQQQNPNVIQRGGRVLPEVPDPNAQGDWSYNQQWTNVPTVATPGYAPPAGSAAVMEAPVPQGHMVPGTSGIPAPPQDPTPISVFGKMRQALPDTTRSALQSHQQALVERFMRNVQAAKMKGVRK